MKTAKLPKVHILGSSWISSASLQGGKLTLVKKDGGALFYAGVPAWALGALMRSKSPGQAYNRLIKDKFQHTGTVPSSASERRAESAKAQDLEERLRASLAAIGATA